MRIALVIPHFDPDLGGAERWTWDFAERLLQHGHEVHVVATSFAANGYPVRQHNVPGVRGGASRRRVAFAAGAEYVLKRLAVDVIHDMGHGWHANVFMPHGGTRSGSFRQNLLLFPNRLRWVKRASSRILPRYRVFREIERQQYRADGSRNFVALSKMVKRDMMAYHSLPERLITVVYNGVDTKRFSQRNREVHRAQMRRELAVNEKDVVFLLVAHNFRLKGVRLAIAAVAKVARQRHDLRLVVVGNDRCAPYQQLAERLQCSRLVQFVGPSDSVPYYAAADVYVHPTLYDPCSLVVLEALASGLPVITTVCNGAGELLTAGSEGYLLDDPLSVTKLAECMMRLMHPDHLNACSRRARQLAERNDLERNYRAMLAVYERAIDPLPTVARGA